MAETADDLSIKQIFEQIRHLAPEIEATIDEAIAADSVVGLRYKLLHASSWASDITNLSIAALKRLGI